MTTTSPAEAQVEVLHLSSVVKRPIVDDAGDRIGAVRDLIIHLAGRPHPPVVGLVAAISGRDVFVPIEFVIGLDHDPVRITGGTQKLGPFERRPGEMLLAKDLLARHLINFVGGRLISANEIELALIEGRWEVVGVDPSSRSLTSRLFSRRHAREGASAAVVDWASIEPFVAHVPTARLRIPYRKLAKLHPAQIADLVEAASHDEGEEIIEAVGQDRELEADVFEELNTEHQLEFIRSRSNAEAANLLGTMAPDDAADLIAELDQERRLPVLGLLPEPQQRKVRSLLNYNPETAGGLMSPDFLCLDETATVTEALDAIRASSAPPEAVSIVFVSDEEGRVSGSVSAVGLIKADPAARLAAVMEDHRGHVHADWDLGATARKMSDYNLIVAPVMDAEHHRLLGVVTVDDVFELMLPTGWRRDFGQTAAED